MPETTTSPAEARAEPAAAAGAHCPNCGAPLTGPWCAQCGQKAAHRIASLRRIIVETLEDQLQLDAALPRTVVTLFGRPGRLTSEYIAGRVMRYIPPIRLYIASSVLFFLCFAMRPASGVVKVSMTSDQAGTHATVTTVDTSVVAISQGQLKKIRRARTDLPAPLRAVLVRFADQLERLKAMPAKERSRMMADRLSETMPKVIFLMLPIFAALLKLLYIRRRRLYVEHFVFALHVHSLAFLTFTPLLFLRGIPFVHGIAYLGLAYYVFRAMRVVYGQGRGRTALKFALLGFAYMIVVGLGMLASSVAAIMML